MDMEQVKQQRPGYRSSMLGPIGLAGEMPPGLTPPLPIEGRIAELCKQVTEASHQLGIARGQFNTARVRRDQAEGLFAKVVEELNYAIQEHREGTPENVSYPR